ncbi:HEPN domain-containing protein [Methanobrevibacter curvatus]|uniref:HEPN domain protein n=1 Tax=Methanobrevibacter curvatus TaxID=49547 RepID=A0A162F9T4_9EURY|nr:HEPN domain-containing protein [Methanobrevibacter curvatus]KZX10005.1 HEPN domain protein [Methanobrevibacter curvatus]
MDNAKLEFNNAIDAIKDFKIALANKRYKNSINRSYYAVFHAAKALLLKKDILTKKHDSTIQQFGLEYVVNGNFDQKIAKIINRLEEDRSEADYAINSIFTEKMQHTI